MSYQVGLGKSPRFVVNRGTHGETVFGAAARISSRPFGATRTTAAVAAPLAISSRAALLPHPIHTTQTLNGLEFSLKPPKWLRKAQPGKILAKAAVPLAIGAALLIPGVAPVVAGAAGAIFKGVKTVVNPLVSLLRPGAKAAINPVTSILTAGRPSPLPIDMGAQPAPMPVSYSPADNVMPAVVTAPAASPDFANAYQQAQVASSQGTMTYDVPTPADAAAPAGGGPSPMLVLGGLAALALIAAASSRKKGRA